MHDTKFLSLRAQGVDLNNKKEIESGLPVDWLVRALADHGVSPSEFLRITDEPYEQLISEEFVVSPLLYTQIFEWASDRLDDPSLGIHIAEKVKHEDMGVLGYLLRTAATLDDWTVLLESYHSIFAPAFQFSFSHRNDRSICTYHVNVLDGGSFKQDIDLSLSLFVGNIRQEIGPDWYPLRCSFSYAAPEDLTEHHRVFGANLEFSRPHNQLEFESDILRVPISSADSRLQGILQQQANQLLAKVEQKNNLVAQVQLLILAGLGDEDLSISSIARKMNVSGRHLRRLLVEQETSFRQLKDATMLQVAKEALLESQSSVTTIAMNLGYSELSAFVRVFKRLVGVSPLQYRKQVSEQTFVG